MLGGVERVRENIKDKYGITFDPKKFTFCVAKWTKFKADGGVIKELVFTYDVTGQVLRIPYQNKLEYQRFLDSGDVSKLPSGINLIG